MKSYDNNGPLFQDNPEESNALLHLGEVDEAELESAMEDPVSLDFIPAFQVFPSMQEEQLAYALLSVRTAAFSRESVRTPLNVCLVLDQSSSMRGDKLYAVKAAARHVVDQLTVADFFTLVSFN